MLKVRPFSALRFDPKKTRWSKTLCPPYDVIRPPQARELRKYAANAIHLELPQGEGAAKYRNGKKALAKWIAQGLLKRDAAPGYYLCEQTYTWNGRAHKRTGLLSALGVQKPGGRDILAHERTYSGPKKDRMKLIKAVKTNTSPIFATFDDPGGRLQKRIAKLKRAKPTAVGTGPDGVRYRFWYVADPKDTDFISRFFAKRSLLVADGHHRFSVGYQYHKETRVPGSWGILTYLVGEADPGLLVLPTHRYVPDDARVRARLAKHAALAPVKSLKTLEAALLKEKDKRAFGVVDAKAKKFFIARPTGGKKGPGGRRLALDWVADNLLFDYEKTDLDFTPDAALLASWVRKKGGLGIVIPDFTVSDIRAAVRKGGLLPQKSTYFYPKIATGLAFRPLNGE